MDLQKNLETLEEENQLLETEIREQEDKLSKLQYRRSDVEDEIMETKRTLLAKAGDLNETEKLVLKEDLDQIGHMLAGLRQEYSMNLVIIDHQVDFLTHEVTISGKLSNFKIAIATKSELVKSIIRKCFTQKIYCCGEEESELEKTTRNEWFNGPYSCCTRDFKYNVEETRVLCDETDEAQKKKYDVWIRSGKNIIY